MTRGVRLTALETEVLERAVREQPDQVACVVEAILLNRRFHRLHPVVAERRLQREEVSRTSPPGHLLRPLPSPGSEDARGWGVT